MERMTECRILPSGDIICLWTWTLLIGLVHHDIAIFPHSVKDDMQKINQLSKRQLLRNTDSRILKDYCFPALQKHKSQAITNRKKPQEYLQSHDQEKKLDTCSEDTHQVYVYYITRIDSKQALCVYVTRIQTPKRTHTRNYTPTHTTVYRHGYARKHTSARAPNGDQFSHPCSM